MEFNSRVEQLYEDVINLGYTGGAMEKNIFIKAFDGGPSNMLFVNLITWLNSQLVCFCNLESKITPYEDAEDLGMKGLGFLVELSSLLKELNCPIKRLTSGSIEDRLANPDDMAYTMMFLCSELQAAKIIFLKKPKKQMPMKIELEESRTAKELKEMLISLNFGKPPNNITPQQLFGEVDKKIKLLSQPSTPKEFVGERLFTGCLTEKQWFQIDDLYKEMFQEYKIRRNLLLTRLDVTIQSFLWADRLKARSGEIKALYDNQKKELSSEPNVKISDILAASADLTVIEKTSSGAVRKNTKCNINKVIIGAVPDRGGRPEEQQPPPPEIPAWQKNDSSSRGGFRGGDRPRQSEAPRQSDRQRQDDSYRQAGRPRQGENFRQSDRPRQEEYSRQSDRPRQSENSRHMDRPRQFQNSGQGDRPRQDLYINQGGAGLQPRELDPNVRPRNNYDFDPAYVDVRSGYNPMFNQSPVQPIRSQLPPQFGFGGYGPAGDNYAQFGTHQSAPGGGDGPRQRGRGGYDRGSRPYRGNSRGRNRY